MPRDEKVKDGLKFILTHLYDESSEYHLFPRRISTKLSDNKQFYVYSEDEAMVNFRKAEFSDCRISAYPFAYKHPPNFIFIDLDCKSDQDEFKFILQNTENIIEKRLTNYKRNIKCEPTVLWTGNGCHIYLPVNCNYNKNGEILTGGGADTLRNQIIDLRLSDLPSTFMKFCEQCLSDYKADVNHNPSIRSCMLRIPGSINSKSNKEVNILKRWNGYRPEIEYLIPDFIEYLSRFKTPSPIIYSDNTDPYNIKWIDLLIDTPITDNRKYVLWKIICPYLINVKKLGYKECYNIIEQWLIKCNAVNRLDFNIRSEIKTKLRYVKHYKPLSLSKVYNDNQELYRIIVDNLNKEHYINNT